MTHDRTSVRKTFNFEDQRRFAALSGDRNPIHLDPIAARRTQAGAPVVHGMHLLLWALDSFAPAATQPVRRIRARFNKFVYVGETATLVLPETRSDAAKLSIAIEGMAVSNLTIDLGSAGTGPVALEQLSVVDLPEEPLNVAFERMADVSGRLPLNTHATAVAELFPRAAAWLGARRLAAMATSSAVVGMLCPGLHSIYTSLSADWCDEGNAADEIAFRVTSMDARFRLVRLSIAGGGITGTVESLARVPPTAQASMVSLAGVAARDEFSGSVALIIGGSRGIGELTAKVIATGGGHVVMTYSVGRNDALAVADEIRAAGGACDVIAYDVRKPASAQLAALTQAPSHLYYFASPIIFGRQSDAFSRTKLNQFMEVYLDGFHELLRSLRDKCPNLSAFYPSSVAVVERPRGMTEYAMAKAAGEILCADMNAALAPLHITVARLPRMETDQTATFIPVESHSALEVMLPLIREVQGRAHSVAKEPEPKL
ncbi:MAG TPA: SDR family NAD(P)-dependent oxidoreductase [Candidatus Polarisedimenticolia bacterium]|nr:SDR family NAD(P)-dependent oxidoreductase [Candidatus Polarisedimenticolia bacterium]